MAMTIGKKLNLSALLFTLVALVPLGVLAIMAISTARDSFIQERFSQLQSVRDIKRSQIQKFFEDREADMDVLVETVSTFRHEAFQKLTAVREVKRQAIERYFRTINDQILTFSEDRMVVESMRKFRDYFRNVRSENAIAPENLDRMRSELANYYTQDFSEEYKEQNGGQAPHAMEFFRQLDDDSMALQYFYIRANKNKLGFKHLLNRAKDASQYSELHAEIHPIIRNYLEKFGYYDIFLVDSDTGHIVYSVFKELDFGTSLTDGPYAKTNFGEAFRRANSAGNRDSVILVDYAKYAPSYEAPASFIASPIFDGNEKIGIAVFQMPIDRLNAIMGERAGLGKTGETFLVGPDKLMRSDSYQDPDNHSVVAAFRSPDKGKVDTEASERAMSGETGADVVMNYKGSPVLSAYTPVTMGGLKWSLLAEIDVAEAFCPVDEKGLAYFSKYVEKNGFYDLFLFNPNGYCFFSVAGEADYQTNLLNGEFKDSGLGKLIKKILATKRFAVADFEPYAPSNGEPAAFIAKPLLHENEVELIVALQLSIESINNIMQERTGMGATGETYLVGSDNLMRSDSFLDPTNHAVKTSFADPQKGRVDTEATKEALSGKEGKKIVIDYNGNPVLSAYTPLQIGDTLWAMMAEIDQQEVVSQSIAAKRLLNRILTVAMVSGLLILLVISFNVFNTRKLVKTLRGIIRSLNEGSRQVASAAGQVSSGSQDMAEGSSEQASSIEETSSSLEEMSSMTRQNANNAKEAEHLTKETGQVVDHASLSMKELNNAMNEISKASEETSKIIRTIDDIAFQTNLLALNAAVEAARAGEAGAGFAVVADEVRNLAIRAADAAKSTAQLIEGTKKKVKDGSERAGRSGRAFVQVMESTSKISELVSEIATASGEQAQGIEQINKAIAEMDKVVQQNAASAEENASVSEQMNAQADQMNEHVRELAVMVGSRKNSDEKGSLPVHGER